MSVSPTVGPFLDPEVVPADRHRRAARVVLVDAGRVLLQHVCLPHRPEHGTWWDLPGGGLESTETTADAALRELAEETGHADAEIGPAIATVRVRFPGRHGSAEQHNVIHVARLRSDRRCEPRMSPGERAGLLDLRWCTPADVADGRRTVLAEIPELVRDAVAGREVPRRLVDRDLLDWPAGQDRPPPLSHGASPSIVDGRVVRDAAPWTPAVQAWLAHLDRIGFAAAPRPLGVDAHGREAVTFVPGDVSGDVSEDAWPGPLRSEDGMAAVGVLLRRLAAAADGFAPPPDAVWRTGPVPFAPGQVVAHGDVGHGNLVWRDDGTPALIDWEFAHPATPLHDLAAAAAWLVPLVDFDHERRGFTRAPNRRGRLHALAAGANLDVATLLDAVAPMLAWERDRITSLGPLGIRPFDAYLADGQPAMFDRVGAWLADHGAALR